MPLQTVPDYSVDSRGETDPETGKEITTTFPVTEKRIVSYNPALAKKQNQFL